MSNCDFPLVGCSSQTVLTISDQENSYFNDRMVSGGVGSNVSFVKMDPTDRGWQHANSTIVFITTASAKTKIQEKTFESFARLLLWQLLSWAACCQQ